MLFPYMCLFASIQVLVSANVRSSSNSTTLVFDDIPTVYGMASIPSIYHHLAFSKFAALSPRDPKLEGYISPNDLNCAVSSPNALIGSRTPSNQATSEPLSMYDGMKGASFSLANASSMIESGLEPHFSLISFNVKPMDAPPPPPTTITVKGYSHSRNKSDPFSWQVDFPAGYHLPFLVKMQEYSVEAWDQLYEVEIVADYGEDELDWEFCLDDLEVQFFRANSTKSFAEYSTGDQVVLEAGVDTQETEADE